MRKMLRYVCTACGRTYEGRGSADGAKCPACMGRMVALGPARVRTDLVDLRPGFLLVDLPPDLLIRRVILKGEEAP